MSLDLSAMAAALYPQQAAPSPAPVEASPPPTEAAAEVEPSHAVEPGHTGAPGEAQSPAEPAIPAEITALREGEAKSLYSRISGLESLPLESALDLPEVDPAAQAAAALEFRHLAADVGASPDEAAQLLATMQGLVATPPSAEQAAQMQASAAEMLTAKYGAEAPAMLDLAKRMISRDPRVHALLERTGAGNDPRTVITAVELAIKQRSQGRLK